MLSDMDFFSNATKMNYAIYDAKELFGENAPYFIERRVDGSLVIFNEHFIRCVRDALTTGCMAKMNDTEENLFARFMAYESGTVYRDVTQDQNEVMEALDKWLWDELHCIPHPTLNSCFDAPKHVWTTCDN